ncbi:MAG: hypothetical protein COA96_10160 [SAR86 cluster bacterium]|uniref:Uncharacterized protein n=1 Tax=SAR86 cluster bacterium TaxID=2030880 RepID=A0A2A5AXW2_9GAMM|nr:MAG: hypothetical protein COA96_10160 [SAR86 cluster bacterium]
MPLWILSIFRSKLARQIGAALVIVGGIFLAGVKWMADRAKLKTMKGAADTNERINDADTGEGDSDADRDWLRDRGKS